MKCQIKNVDGVENLSIKLVRNIRHIFDCVVALTDFILSRNLLINISVYFVDNFIQWREYGVIPQFFYFLSI